MGETVRCVLHSRIRCSICDHSPRHLFHRRFRFYIDLQGNSTEVGKFGGVGQGIRVVKKTGFENQFFQKLVFKKKKKQRNLEGKKKPTLFTRPFCKCRPQIRADSIFSPAFFPRLEPWLNHGSAFEKWMFLEFFLPAAPFFIFCSAKKGSLSGSVV